MGGLRVAHCFGGKIKKRQTTKHTKIAKGREEREIPKSKCKLQSAKCKSEDIKRCEYDMDGSIGGSV
jgi:hypothetical protein